MTENEILDANMFMMCQTPNKLAYKDIPSGYHIRKLKKEELPIWFEFPFDTVQGDKTEYVNYMKEYFNKVYKAREEEFFNSCLVICNEQDIPVGTCFAWKIYDKFWTIHWFKVYSNTENKGLGKALLTEVMKTIPENEYPVYLHTQPGSYRAIKIYSDFGFKILTDEKVGKRVNQFNEAVDYLKKQMGVYYNSLSFTKSNGELSKQIENVEYNQF